MENTPIEFGIIANRWALELRSFTQRETAVLFEHINDLNAVGWRGWHERLRLYLRARIFNDSKLPFMPFLLPFLSNQAYGIANSVCRAAMSRPGISDEEKNSSLRPFQRVTPLMHITSQTKIGTKDIQKSFIPVFSYPINL